MADGGGGAELPTPAGPDDSDGGGPLVVTEDVAEDVAAAAVESLS